ncbi:MAG: shikimate dehydrogenase [bacterium]|nr:shikimate dehydrogenase [bacterium]
MNINALTKIVGLIGYPIDYTLSPDMHNAAFKELNLNFVYLPFRVKSEDLPLAINGLSALNIVGVNVTIPHKELVMKYLDDLSEEAGMIGAVNTICVQNGKLRGDNTDGKGFVASLREELKVDPAGKKVFILGAGGAARAIGFSLAKLGVKRMTMTDIEMPKAERLSADIKHHFHGLWLDTVGLNDRKFEENVLDCDILINATPCGMHQDDPLLINPDWFSSNQVVYDIIYNPGQTHLLKAAKEKGCLTQNGLGMLIHQGALSFELWTGEKAPIEVMRQAIVESRK